MAKEYLHTGVIFNETTADAEFLHSGVIREDVAEAAPAASEGPLVGGKLEGGGVLVKGGVLVRS